MNKIYSVAAALIVALGMGAPTIVGAQAVSLPYTLQVDPGVPNTASKQQQDAVIALMARHLGLWLARDPARYPYEGIITEDAVFQYPQSEEASLRLIRGRSAVAAALRHLPQEAIDWTFSDVKLVETPHPDIFFVAYRAKAYVPSTHRIYDQQFVARITIRDGKIADYYEMWDGKAKAIAFGTLPLRRPS